ncbi:MAG: hypothetical protein ACK4E8_03495 [Lacibacter sp.]
MELNNILLTHDQLVEWYGTHLVAVGEGATAPKAVAATIPQPAEKEATIPTLPVKGGFTKGVLWVVQEPNAAYVTDADFELLTKVLQACKLTWNDAGLVNLHPHPQPVATLAARLQPQYLICCGLAPELLGETAPMYQPLEGYGCKVLVTDALPVINSSKEKKVQLWHALKSFFQLT